MASIEGSMAAMSKALESQNLIVELVSEGAKLMEQMRQRAAGTHP